MLAPATAPPGAARTRTAGGTGAVAADDGPYLTSNTVLTSSTNKASPFRYVAGELGSAEYHAVCSGQGQCACTARYRALLSRVIPTTVSHPLQC